MLVLPASPRCAAASRPRTAADIRWPTPSQPPGRVVFHPRHPIETSWDPALEAFRKQEGTTFDRMIEIARRRAPRPGSPRRFHDSAGASGRNGPLLAVDIVRIPGTLEGRALEHAPARLERQLTLLAAQGWPYAVWEVRDLPPPDKLDDWAKRCFAAFPRPPLLMLGWHLSRGRIRPEPARMKLFLARWADRAHSIILTGEELNTQFYAVEDGGRALPFLTYWLGVVRAAHPDVFVWCRIDEQLKRRNQRNAAWLEHFFSLTDGVNYQVAFGFADLRYKGVSEQYRRLRRVMARLAEKRGSTVPPVLLGGFTYAPSREAAGGDPDAGGPVAAMTRRAREAVRRMGVFGWVRYVGMLPEQPSATLFGSGSNEVLTRLRTGGAAGKTGEQ